MEKRIFTAINFDEVSDLHTNNVCVGKFASRKLFQKYYSYETSGEKCIDLFVVRENKSTHFAIHV